VKQKLIKLALIVLVIVIHVTALSIPYLWAHLYDYVSKME